MLIVVYTRGIIIYSCSLCAINDGDEKTFYDYTPLNLDNNYYNVCYPLIARFYMYTYVNGGTSWAAGYKHDLSLNIITTTNLNFYLSHKSN